MVLLSVKMISDSFKLKTPEIWGFCLFLRKMMLYNALGREQIAQDDISIV